MVNIARALVDPVYFFKLFKRKKEPPLACHLTLDEGEEHIHTAACFVDIEPLAIAELFQARGCASCPPATPGIIEATTNPNIQLLTYEVTYFNHLSKDPDASTQWDQRQKAYVRAWKRTAYYTPMVVVNGLADGGSNGGTVAEIQGTVRRARDAATQAIDWHIIIDANDTYVRIDTDKLESEAYDVLVIVYRNSEEVTKIPDGPNKKQKWKQKNIVQRIVKIGEWTGGDAVIPLQAATEQLQHGQGAVAVVQGKQGGAIVAACQVI